MKGLTLAAMAALSLGACNSPPGGKVAGLCTPFATAPATPAATAGVPALTAPAATDPSAPVEDCLHRWAYSLAGSTDDADTVARATVAACSPALSKWNQAALAPADGGAGSGGGAMEAPSLVTGEPINAFAAHREFAESRALFFVVQARAGKCAPPPPAKS